MSTTQEKLDRRNEVWSFLYSIRIEEFDSGTWEALKITGAEIAEYLNENEAAEPPELDVDLLRERLTWARKSMTVKEPFGDIDWRQHTWLNARLSDTDTVPATVTVTDECGNEITGYVSENFCDTVGCIAGGIAMLHGNPVWTRDEGLGSRNYGATVMDTGQTIEDFAGEKLGLTTLEKRFMFDGDVTIDFLETLAEGVCLRRGLEY